MQDLWDTTKRLNLWIMDIEEGKEAKSKGIKKVFYLFNII
jgi:hypothetical protein